MGDARMIDKITIRERGAVPRKLRKVYTAAKRTSWLETGKLFHTEMRDQRFTAEHARKAGYAPRQGETAGLGKKFWNTYTGQKLKWKGHKRPLEWSGETRRAVRYGNISHTTKGARVAYPGARKLNFRRWPSSPHMADEFRRLLPDEIRRLAEEFDRVLDREMNRDQSAETRQV